MNKFYFVVILNALLGLPLLVDAKSGCCSHHGGVIGCNTTTGFNQCADGTDSPSCTCTNSNAYNSSSYNKRSANLNYSTSSEYKPLSSNESYPIEVYKCTDSKGIVHFSDTKLSKECKQRIR